jgi:hypothetical protein
LNSGCYHLQKKKLDSSTGSSLFIANKLGSIQKKTSDLDLSTKGLSRSSSDAALIPVMVIDFLKKTFVDSMPHYEMTLLVYKKLQTVFMRTFITRPLISRDPEQAVCWSDQIFPLTKKTYISDIANAGLPRLRDEDASAVRQFINSSARSLAKFNQEVHR